MIRIRSRFLGLAALALSVVSLTACGTDSETSTIKLTETNLDNASLTIGAADAISIRGLIESDVAGLSVTYNVLDKNFSNVNEDFTINTATIGASETSWSLGDPKKGNGTIKANSSLTVSDTGTYYLRIVVKNSSGNEDSATVTFKVKANSTTVVGTPLVVAASNLDVGGSNAAAGSFISIGAAAVYNSTDSKTKFASIDLYTTTNVDGQATFKSTASARTAYNAGEDVGTLTSDYWGNGRSTIVTQVASAATTLEQAKTSLTGITTQETPINTTDASSYYLVKTTDNVYALLTVTSVSKTGADITFKLTILK